MANLQSPNLEWDCVTCRSGGFQVQGFVCMNGFPIFAGEVGGPSLKWGMLRRGKIGFESAWGFPHSSSSLP